MFLVFCWVFFVGVFFGNAGFIYLEHCSMLLSKQSWILGQLFHKKKTNHKIALDTNIFTILVTCALKLIKTPLQKVMHFSGSITHTSTVLYTCIRSILSIFLLFFLRHAIVFTKLLTKPNHDQIICPRMNINIHVWIYPFS